MNNLPSALWTTVIANVCGQPKADLYMDLRECKPFHGLAQFSAKVFLS